MICIFLGIVIVLLLVLFFSNKEGMEVKCKYQYLGPNQKNTPLDDATINQFINLYNDNMTKLGSKPGTMDKNGYDSMIKNKFICTEEIQFYIKNKSFPINEFIVNELSTNTNIKFPKGLNKDNIAIAMTVRFILVMVFSEAYSDKTNLPPDVKESMSIYQGSKPEPECDYPVEPDSKTYACNNACNDACSADSAFIYNS